MTSKLIRKERCPECAKNDRDISEDNLAVYDDGHSYCFSCGLYQGKKDDRGVVSDFTYEYLPWRGVSKETMQFYDVKTKVDQDGQPRSLGFGYPNGAFKVRSLDEKSFYSTGSPSGLFGRDKFSPGEHKYVTVTEGELDTLSLYEVLKAPVVSVKSAASASSDCAADRPWLNQYERVYLAFDGDTPGREATAAVAKLFDYNKVYVVKFSRLDRKDANDYLRQGEVAELKHLWWNSKQYLPETIISSFSDFREILSKPPEKGISYPFPTLTDMTYGIRRGETVLITAQEKVGKTALMHAIEHHLLKETDSGTNIGAIFLEEPPQRHLQALAGIELQKPIHLPDIITSPDEVMAAIEQTVGCDDRLHMVNYFGSEDPGVLLDHIRFLVTARSCLYVLLDHISIVVSGLTGDDERRKLDWFATRLEMMVKELNFALLMVSHVNDEGKTRGSRFLTKVCDIHINAVRDPMNPDPVERNIIDLSIPLNRFCSKTGPAGRVEFDATTYLLKERFDATAANDNRPFERLGVRSAA